MTTEERNKIFEEYYAETGKRTLFILEEKENLDPKAVKKAEAPYQAALAEAQVQLEEKIKAWGEAQAAKTTPEESPDACPETESEANPEATAEPQVHPETEGETTEAPETAPTDKEEEDDSDRPTLSTAGKLAAFRLNYAFRLCDPMLKTLPPFLQQVAMVSEDFNMAATTYLSALGVISVCLPGVRCSWYNKMEQPNLFLFITGAAATGKGKAELCRHLVAPISEEMLERSRQVQQNYIALTFPNLYYNHANASTNLPGLPPLRRLFVPANSSGSAMLEDIATGEGTGLIFETEADTLGQALRRMDFSDLLRKSFHGETVSMRRRSHGGQNIVVENPNISIVLTGTPEQVKSIFKSAENGLFSRFLFYKLDLIRDRDGQFSHADGEQLESHFKELGRQFYAFYNRLRNKPKGVEILLSDSQRLFLESAMSDLQYEYFELFGATYATETACNAAFSTGTRMGNIVLRIAMIRTMLRYVDYEKIPNQIPCNDDDLVDAIYDARTFMQNAHIIFDDMVTSKEKPAAESVVDLKSPDLMSDNVRALWEALPDQFRMVEAIKIASEHGHSLASLKLYLKSYIEEYGLLTRVSKGHYEKNKYPMANG